MHRLQTSFGEYLCAAPPSAVAGGTIDEALSRGLGTAGEAPVLYWDATTTDDGRVTWGDGGLDPILAGERDLSGCVAISGEAVRRLVARRSLRRETELARALAVLLRGGGAASVKISGLLGQVDVSAAGPMADKKGAATTAERITLALLLGPQATEVGPFLSAVSAQDFSSRVDLLVVGDGLSPQVFQGVADHLDGWAAPWGVRVRRHAFSPEIPTAFLRNAVVAMAQGEVVVFADPRVAPNGSRVFQRLADWAAGGGVTAASCRLEKNGRLLAAGLTLADAQNGVQVARSGLYADALRETAAPNPWLFAANRRLWMEAGGLPPVPATELWTAGFAAFGGPRGRVLHVGAEVAEWSSDASAPGVDATATLSQPLQPHARRALRGPKPSSAPPPAAVSPPKRDEPRLAHAFDDGRRASATRLLVFADAFGPSQAIVFQHALREARASGRIAVRVIEEAAFGGDGRSLDQPDLGAQVRAEIDAFQPDILIASRLGHAGVVDGLIRAARSLALPLLAHLDDDLLDLPLSAGIERYRLARAPRRLAALRAGLDAAQVVLAATPALAERLRTFGTTRPVIALTSGVGADGAAPARRPRADGRVRVGYMGSASHDADLAMIAPALNAVTEAAPEVELHLFGSIARQPAADQLTRLTARHPAVTGDYAAFKRRLAELDWDIGLAPLRPTAFNRRKTAVKWAEYADAAAAVLASELEPYTTPIMEGAALGVCAAQGWTTALHALVKNPHLRERLTDRAAGLLRRDYSWSALGREVEQALGRAVALHDAEPPAKAAA